MNGIHYITNEKGKRISVVLDLRKHAEFWEDFCDIMLAKKAREEADWISWEEAKRLLHPNNEPVRNAAKRQHHPVNRSKPAKK